MTAKIKIAVVSDPSFAHSGCWWYRLLQPYYALLHYFPEKYEVNIIEHAAAMRGVDPKYWDVYVFHPSGLPPNFDTFFDWALKERIRVVMDLDDPYDLIPEHNIAKRTWTPEALDYLHDFIERASAITVTTQALADHYAPLSQKIFVCPNGINFDNLDARGMRRLRNGRKPVVYWGGSISHGKDIEVILPLSTAFKEQAHFTLVTPLPASVPAETPWRMFLGSKCEDYVEWLISLDTDIGLAPLQDTPFNACKSNVKLLEYAAAECAILCSHVGPYRDWPLNAGIHLPFDAATWKERVEDLLSNPELRDLLGRHANEYARENFRMKTLLGSYEAMLESVMAGPRLYIA